MKNKEKANIFDVIQKAGDYFVESVEERREYYLEQLDTCRKIRPALAEEEVVKEVFADLLEITPDGLIQRIAEQDNMEDALVEMDDDGVLEFDPGDPSQLKKVYEVAKDVHQKTLSVLYGILRRAGIRVNIEDLWKLEFEMPPEEPPFETPVPAMCPPTWEAVWEEICREANLPPEISSFKKVGFDSGEISIGKILAITAICPPILPFKVVTLERKGDKEAAKERTWLLHDHAITKNLGHWKVFFVACEFAERNEWRIRKAFPHNCEILQASISFGGCEMSFKDFGKMAIEVGVNNPILRYLLEVIPNIEGERLLRVLVGEFALNNRYSPRKTNS